MAQRQLWLIGFGPSTASGIAQAFGRAGFDLVLFARNPARHVEQLAALQELGVQIELVSTDVSQPLSLEHELRECLDRSGPPQVLIYNAVAFRWAKPSEVEPHQLLNDFQVNVASALLAAQIVLPEMTEKGGTILFSGGSWGHHPSHLVCSTSLGKGGLRHLALMLNEELRGTAVRAAMITIAGEVRPDSDFDPQRVGDYFLQTATQADLELPGELHFNGANLPG